jgi:Zinc carboxypeptidase
MSGGAKQAFDSTARGRAGQCNSRPTREHWTKVQLRPMARATLWQAARHIGYSSHSVLPIVVAVEQRGVVGVVSFFHVVITGLNRRHLTELGPKHRIIVVGYREKKTGEIEVDAYLNGREEQWLKKHGYAVTRLEEVTAPARQRQAEGRRDATARLKRGRYGDVIWGGGYLTADEIERAMVLGERNHGDYLERIALPNLTWEKRRCHVIRIGKRQGRKRTAICFIAGIHGREWGGPDILVYFAIRLLRAYRDRQGIRLGKKVFSAAQIRQIVETKDVILFPQVNPDGRHFSMVKHPWWRKNRRPAPRGRGPKSIGVDLNRNFPILWDFERHFAPGTVQSSRKPGDYETYAVRVQPQNPRRATSCGFSIAFRISASSSIFTATARPCSTIGAATRTSRTIRRCAS